MHQPISTCTSNLLILPIGGNYSLNFLRLQVAYLVGYCRYSCACYFSHFAPQCMRYSFNKLNSLKHLICDFCLYFSVFCNFSVSLCPLRTHLNPRKYTLNVCESVTCKSRGLCFWDWTIVHRLSPIAHAGWNQLRTALKNVPLVLQVTRPTGAHWLQILAPVSIICHQMYWAVNLYDKHIGRGKTTLSWIFFVTLSRLVATYN